MLAAQSGASISVSESNLTNNQTTPTIEIEDSCLILAQPQQLSLSPNSRGPVMIGYQALVVHHPTDSSINVRPQVQVIQEVIETPLGNLIHKLQHQYALDNQHEFIKLLNKINFLEIDIEQKVSAQLLLLLKELCRADATTASCKAAVDYFEARCAANPSNVKPIIIAVIGLIAGLAIGCMLSIALLASAGVALLSLTAGISILQGAAIGLTTGVMVGLLASSHLFFKKPATQAAKNILDIVKQLNFTN
jgi:hypothetical protein